MASQTAVQLTLPFSAPAKDQALPARKSQPLKLVEAKRDDLIASGEILLSQSGRKLTPFPESQADTERKTKAALQKIDAWLLENARAEALAWDDDHASTLLKGIELGNVSPADRDMMSVYLFGDAHPTPRRAQVAETGQPAPDARPSASPAISTETGQTGQEGQPVLKKDGKIHSKPSQVISEPSAPPTLSKAAKAREKAAAKLQAMADKLEAKGKEKLNADRLANTPRRARMAASAMEDARKDIALAKTMRNLAVAIADGRAQHLGKVSQKTQVQDLSTRLRQAGWAAARAQGLSSDDYTASKADAKYATFPVFRASAANLKRWSFKLEDMEGGQAIAERFKTLAGTVEDNDWVELRGKDALLAQKSIEVFKKSGEPGPWQLVDTMQDITRLHRMAITDDAELQAALAEFAEYREAPKAEDPVKRMERDLVGLRIQGFFPTPAPVVDILLARAGIEPGHRVLEPSAGKGDIADRILESHPDADLDLEVIEWNDRLRAILEAKGHNIVGMDFMEHDPGPVYQRVVMNPPFEQGQEVKHIRHAFNLLAPGGRLVSVMSTGPWFRSFKVDTEFRKWVELHGGVKEDLPAGSFAQGDVPTGVSTIVLVIDKAA